MSLFRCFGNARRSKKGQKRLEDAVLQSNVYLSNISRLETEISENKSQLEKIKGSVNDKAGHDSHIIGDHADIRHNAAQSRAQAWLDKMEKDFHKDIVNNSKVGRYEFLTKTSSTGHSILGKRIRSLGHFLRTIFGIRRKHNA